MKNIKLKGKPMKKKLAVKTVKKLKKVGRPRKAEIAQKAVGKKKSKFPYVIVRTYSAGVFAGYLKAKKGMEVTLSDAIRIWGWEGAASLSQLAMEGVKKPHECKFAMPVNQVELMQAIEILRVTEQAKKNILDVPSWKV